MRFLFHVLDNSGACYSTVPIARELKKRGHEVLLFPFKLHSFFNLFNEKIPALDVDRIIRGEHLELYEHDLPLTRSEHPFPTPKRLQELAAFAKVNKHFVLPLIRAYIPLANRVVEEFKPDVISVDYLSIAGAFVAESRHLPWATLYRFTSFVDSRGTPPMAMGWPSSTNFFVRQFYDLVRLGMFFYFRQFDEPLNLMRKELGLPPKRDLLRKATASPYLILAFSVPEFESPRDGWPPQLHFVGPYLWNTPGDFQPPSWLTSLPDSRPVVYMTLGTLVTRLELELFSLTMEALKGMEATGIISTGSYNNDWVIGRLPAPPENCRLERFIPNSLILPKASAVIHHGGIGTTIAALSNGVPQIIIPLTFDNFDHAQRCAEAGAAIRVSRKGLTAAKLKKAIREILSNPVYASHARKMAEIFSRYDSPVMAADLLQDLARKKGAVYRHPPDSR